jgi:hypothetical protein
MVVDAGTRQNGQEIWLRQSSGCAKKVIIRLDLSASEKGFCDYLHENMEIYVGLRSREITEMSRKRSSSQTFKDYCMNLALDIHVSRTENYGMGVSAIEMEAEEVK